MRYGEENMNKKIDNLFQEMVDARKKRELALSELCRIFLNARRRKVITAKEYRILKLRFAGRKTLEEVGQEFGVTRDRIRQIQFRAIQKIGRHDRISPI